MEFAQALKQITVSYRSIVARQALDALSICLDLIAHKRAFIRVLNLTSELRTVTDRLLDLLHAEGSNYLSLRNKRLSN